MKKLLVFLLVVSSAFSQTPLEYLNKKRTNAGMTIFSANSLLNQSAQNHADYVSINVYSYAYEGHHETASKPGFTGEWPWDRAYAVGYKSSASENMTVGYDDYHKSIDGLFTAIYHRLGFLDFSYNEIGLGESINTEYGDFYTHVYNMGNSDLNELCNGTSYSGYEQYYYSICSDSFFRVEASLYDQKKVKNALANPEIVTWPYENQVDFQPAFFEESPDPLPSCSITGNPISIQFNPSSSGNISMQSFKLYDKNNSEITDVTLMNETSDFNNHFTNKDFALFPMQRLDYGSKYKAEFIYTEDGVSKTKEWNFYTKVLANPYYVATTGAFNTFNVISGKTYSLYIPPSDCNDSRASYSSIYSASSSNIEIIDANTYEVTVTGTNGQYLEITLDNGTILKLVISSTDSALISNNLLDTDSDGAPDVTDADDDNDEMPDIYENSIEGLNPLVNDANDDLDEDGKTNLEEYQENTNPNDVNSRVFTLTLSTGWNLVSLELNSSVNLTTLNKQNIDVVRSLQDNRWKIWSKNSISTAETALTTLEDGYGYWIKVSQNTTIDILGDGIADVIPIVENEWNMLGSRNITNINQFFIDNPNVKMIWMYKNGEYQSVSSYVDIQSDLNVQNISTITNINLNEGFFIK